MNENLSLKLFKFPNLPEKVQESLINREIAWKEDQIDQKIMDEFESVMIEKYFYLNISKVDYTICKRHYEFTATIDNLEGAVEELLGLKGEEIEKFGQRFESMMDCGIIYQSWEWSCPIEKFYTTSAIEKEEESTTLKTFVSKLNEILEEILDLLRDLVEENYQTISVQILDELNQSDALYTVEGVLIRE